MEFDALIAELDAVLRPLAFEPRERVGPLDDVRVRGLWRRRTWLTNHAVAVLEVLDPSLAIGPLAQRSKVPVGKLVGYVPVLHSLGLQLVLVGAGEPAGVDDLASFVDKVDNQRVVLQSIHVVDAENRRSVSERTWGQVLSGRYQDAIEKAIDGYRALGRETDRTRSTP